MKNFGSRSVVIIIALSLLLITLFPLGLMAAEVGKFTQVEGQVGLYKGKTPTPIPVQAKTAAETNDRIKTEALSRAQFQFLDASTLTVAPLSDIVIESYMYDPKKGEQGALSKLTQGLVRLVVPVETLAQKQFLVKTSDAIIGIRGTELYILIGPDFTDVYVKTGTVSASSNQPNKADKVSMGSPGRNGAGEVTHLARQADIRAAKMGPRMIGAMQASRIKRGESPSPLISLTAEDFATLEGLLNTGLPAKMGDSKNPSDLLRQIRELGPPLGYTPPGPPPAPGGVGPSFPGGGGGGGGSGGGVASPSS
jgi:hypothetical protein